MLENCDVIIIFSIYGQFGAIVKPDSRGIVCKTYIFINTNLLSDKTENRPKKYLTQLSHYCFEERYYFGEKMLATAKLKGPWY